MILKDFEMMFKTIKLLLEPLDDLAGSAFASLRVIYDCDFQDGQGGLINSLLKVASDFYDTDRTVKKKIL